MKLQTFQEFRRSGEKIVSMVNFNGTVLVATSHSVYAVCDSELREVTFMVRESPDDTLLPPGLAQAVRETRQADAGNADAGAAQK